MDAYEVLENPPCGRVLDGLPLLVWKRRLLGLPGLPDAIRASAFETLSLPTDGTAAVKALVREFHETATQTEHGWASNPFARLEGRQLR
jgi:hypothetical protein